MYKKHPFFVPVLRDTDEVKYQNFDKQLVQYDGMVVTWSSLVTAELSCSFDVSKFPFDSQTCPIGLTKWASLGTHDFKMGIPFRRKNSKSINQFMYCNRCRLLVHDGSPGTPAEILPASRAMGSDQTDSDDVQSGELAQQRLRTLSSLGDPRAPKTKIFLLFCLSPVPLCHTLRPLHSSLLVACRVRRKSVLHCHYSPVSMCHFRNSD